MASTGAHGRTLLPPSAAPPRSKTQPYYSIHPLWQDVTPIPQSDDVQASQDASVSPLATIAYAPRYAEAMSYLRAVMAANEVSERALALTSDLINMNPAHYTVWIYRMMVLKGLWRQSDEPRSEESTGRKDGGADVQSAMWKHVETELTWLNELSARNLKNYQIWHHRNALVDLLPPDPGVTTLDSSSDQIMAFLAKEQRFLASILSLDTKNYHVWSYRQWICSRYPSILLPSFPTLMRISDSAFDGSSMPNTSVPAYLDHHEIVENEKMITDDIRNNSAWSHRYFLLFGQVELTYASKHNALLKDVFQKGLLQNDGLLDTGLVQAEIEYTMNKIELAPQNASSWNYLRGLLRHGQLPLSHVQSLCESFLGSGGDVWADQYSEVDGRMQQTGVRSSHAVEWLAEIYASGTQDADTSRIRECYQALGQKWDPIRRKYWEWKTVGLLPARVQPVP